MQYTTIDDLMKEPIFRPKCPTCGGENSLAKAMLMDQGEKAEDVLQQAFLTPADPVEVKKATVEAMVMVRCWDECLDCGTRWVKKIQFVRPRYQVDTKSISKN